MPLTQYKSAPEGQDSDVTSFSSNDVGAVNKSAAFGYQQLHLVNPSRYRHNPYGLCLGHYRPRPVEDRYQGITHRPLLGICRFVAIPHIDASSRTVTLPPRAHALTISQTRFELSCAELRWLVRHLTGITLLIVTAVNGEALKSRSFLCHASSAKEAREVQRALHLRVLFDLRGVFVLDNYEQQLCVKKYMQEPEFKVRSQRLPRQLMWVTVVNNSEAALTKHHASRTLCLPHVPEYVAAPMPAADSYIEGSQDKAINWAM